MSNGREQPRTPYLPMTDEDLKDLSKVRESLQASLKKMAVQVSELSSPSGTVSGLVKKAARALTGKKK